MQVTYDRDADALYVKLADSPVSRTDQIDAGTLVDLDRFGHIVGVEVLQPMRPWPIDDIVNRYGIDHEAHILLKELADEAWGSPRFGGTLVAR